MRYFWLMAVNFTSRIVYKGNPMLAVIIPQRRKNGLHYEVNIPGYPRFFMSKTALDRYDIIGEEQATIPYEMVLAVNDTIEAFEKKV